MMPDTDRKLKNLGTNNDNNTKMTINTASGAATVDLEKKCLILVVQISEALIQCSPFQRIAC